MHFEGKRVLVTGAGSGIGRTIAIRLSDLGAEVFGVSRTLSNLESLKNDHPSIHIKSLDVGDRDATHDAIRAMLPLHFVVNNAAILYRTQSVLDIDSSKFDEMIDVNLKAPINIMQIVAKDLIARSLTGSFVNISGIASKTYPSDLPFYATTKAGLNHITKCFASELGSKGIRVNAILPTVVPSGMTNEFLNSENYQAKKTKIPLKRFATQDDVGDAVIFLLSDKSSMITGHCLPVDGGQLVG